MYHHLKTYKRPILAFFGVFLMISFLLTGYIGSGQQNGDPDIGKVGNQQVKLSDLRAATSEWAFLNENLFGIDRQRGQPVPVALAALGQEAAAQIRQHPEMYFLLLNEARRAGVTVSRDTIETRLRNEGIYVRPPGGGQPTEFNRLTDPRLQDQVRAAVTDLMTIRANFERAASVVKISEPLRRRQIADQFQELKLRLVEFAAKDFEKTVPAPTTQQLQNQFDRFADSEPDASPSPVNPLGFGYRYPNRVKLQYLSLPASELRRVVFASRPADRWEVDAIRYYNKNQKLYATTQPASQPAAVVPDDLSLDAPKKLNGATTRPFEDVRAEATDAVLKPEIDKLSDQVLRRVRSILQSDYQAFAAAGGAVDLPVGVAAPSTRPVSSTGAAYDSFEYLQKVAQSVQKEFGVLPTVVSLADNWLAVEDLQKLPGLGTARDDDSAFVTMAAQNVIDFVSPAQKDYPTTLRLYQPSPVLKDATDNAYVFRVTATRLAGRPAEVKEVAAKVEQDWRAAQAFDAARAAATKTLDAAKTKPLQAVADEMKLKVTTTGEIQNQPYGPSIKGVTISPLDHQAFVAGTFSLLQVKSDVEASANKQPVASIELPSERKIMVAELADVGFVKRFADLPESYRDGMVTMQLQQVLGQTMQAGWFNFDAVKARTGYEPREERAKSKSAAL